MVRARATIAIVDDDAPLRLALDNLIRSGGFSAGLFADAESFLADPDHSRFHLLLTDIQMPGMSGPELVRTLRRDGKTIPVIIMTAVALDQLPPRVRATPAFLFVEKPFDGDMLLSAIEQALARR